MPQHVVIARPIHRVAPRADAKAESLSLCRAVIENPDMPNPAAKIAAWVVGVASKTGGFPVEVNGRQIEFGFEANGVKFEGTNNHRETIKSALEWLEERGIIRVEEGAVPYWRGHKPNLIHWTYKDEA